MATTETFVPGRLYEMPLADLQPDPNQPRKYLDPAALDELTESVKQQSVVAPILFRMENGLAFSPDQTILYYTETVDGVWAYDLATQTRKQIYNPGRLQIFDDIATAPDGTLWFCLNSEQAMVPIKNGTADVMYRVAISKHPHHVRSAKALASVPTSCISPNSHSKAAA